MSIPWETRYQWLRENLGRLVFYANDWGPGKTPRRLVSVECRTDWETFTPESVDVAIDAEIERLRQSDAALKAACEGKS